MKSKPSIENSIAFVDVNRKFTFGFELLVKKTGLIFALGLTMSFNGLSSGGVRSWLVFYKFNIYNFKLNLKISHPQFE